MLTVDLNIDAIRYVINNKIGFVISYYGLISNPVKIFPTILVKKLLLLSRFPISVFALGKPYVTADNGVCDIIADELYLNNSEILSITNKSGKRISIGRICSPQLYPNQTESFQLKHLLERAKNNVESSIIMHIGELEKNVEKIAIVGIERVNINILIELKKLNIDCLISAGTLGQRESILANDLKLSVVSLSFFDCIKKALEKLQTVLSLEFPNEEFFLYDSKNPYNLGIFEKKNLLQLR